MQNLTKEICFKFKEARRAAGLTQNAIAAEIGCHQAALSMFEQGDGTKLGELYKSGEYKPLEQSEYVDIVCDALELLPCDTVVGRLTGDGEREKLLAPLWSLKKTCVVNDIDKELYARGSWQGKKYSK